MTKVVAVSANPALVNSVEDFIASVEHGRSNSADKFIEMADHMTDRMLSLFLVEPSRMVKLTGTQQKVIDFAITTAGKASHMLTRQIFKKTTNEQFAPIVRNIDAMYWRPGPDNDNQPMLSVEADPAVASDFIRAADLCAAGEGKANIDLVTRSLDALADLIIEEFFVANTREVKIGFVTQKALNVGVDGSRKAVHAVSKKVLAGLDDEHLREYMAHYRPLLRERG